MKSWPIKKALDRKPSLTQLECLKQLKKVVGQSEDAEPDPHARITLHTTQTVPEIAVSRVRKNQDQIACKRAREGEEEGVQESGGQNTEVRIQNTEVRTSARRKRDLQGLSSSK